jgi:hypothetical protein
MIFWAVVGKVEFFRPPGLQVHGKSQAKIGQTQHHSRQERLDCSKLQWQFNSQQKTQTVLLLAISHTADGKSMNNH